MFWGFVLARMDFGLRFGWVLIGLAALIDCFVLLLLCVGLVFV